MVVAHVFLVTDIIFIARRKHRTTTGVRNDLSTMLTCSLSPEVSDCQLPILNRHTSIIVEPRRVVLVDAEALV